MRRRETARKELMTMYHNEHDGPLNRIDPLE